jgi:hypothetical protein
MSVFSMHGLAPVGAVLLCFTWAAGISAQTRGTAGAKPGEVAVDLFAALAAGDIEVKVIAKNSTKGNVFIRNNTARPLAIRLPEAFAALPVAAQVNPFAAGNGVGFQNNGNFNGRNGGNMGANQALGAGFQGGQNMGLPGQPGMNGAPANFGGGIFRVEPEKVGKLKMVAVCLEHGKPDPNPHIEYRLQPLDSYTQHAPTVEVVKMLARREIDQRTAQAAAWHFEQGKSWEELAAITATVHLGGRKEPYFTAEQIAAGMHIAAEAKRRAAREPEPAERSNGSLASAPSRQSGN